MLRYEQGSPVEGSHRYLSLVRVQSVDYITVVSQVFISHEQGLRSSLLSVPSHRPQPGQGLAEVTGNAHVATRIVF